MLEWGLALLNTQLAAMLWGLEEKAESRAEQTIRDSLSHEVQVPLWRGPSCQPGWGVESPEKPAAQRWTLRLLMATRWQQRSAVQPLQGKELLPHLRVISL
jgi:hypothetical protein